MVKESFKFGLGYGLGVCAGVAIAWGIARLGIAVYDNYQNPKEKDHLPDNEQKD